MIEISITSRPQSGLYEEIDFSYSNDLLWVKFIEDDYTQWLGKFQLGWKPGKCKISSITNTSCVAILSGGIINIFDFNERQILTTSKRDFYEDIQYLKKLDVLVITDGISIEIADPLSLETIWESERVSWDGIKFDRHEERFIFGTLNDLSDDGANFEFDATNRCLKANYKVIP